MTERTLASRMLLALLLLGIAPLWPVSLPAQAVVGRPEGTHDAKIVADDGLLGDAFGWSVSISGSTAAAGARKADIGDNEDQGAAYVYYRDPGGTGTWSQIARLVAADGMAGDEFGNSIWVGMDTILVGAPKADVQGNSNQGAVYVFYRNQGGTDVWGQVDKLTAGDGAAEERFGKSVAGSGDTAVVGAYWADVGGRDKQGAAYVFYRHLGGADAWGQAAKLTAADGSAADWFGSNVAADGDTMLAAVPYADIDDQIDQGAAYVFERNQGGPDAWGQVAKLLANDGDSLDWVSGVDVDGAVAVMGALGADGHQGAAYVFYRDQGGPGAWGQTAKLSAADAVSGDEFGGNVSLDGDIALIGAHFATVGSDNQGAAYVYARDEGGADAWGQVDKLTAGDGAAGDYFGWPVALSGAAAISGASGADVEGAADQGAAYIFYLSVPEPPRLRVFLPIAIKQSGN